MLTTASTATITLSHVPSSPCTQRISLKKKIVPRENTNLSFNQNMRFRWDEIGRLSNFPLVIKDSE